MEETMKREHEHRLTAVEDRSKSNTHRIDRLEKTTSALNSLATSVAVMANEQKRMGENLEKVTEAIETIEAKPGKRWDSIVEKAILTIVGILVGAALAHFGIK